MPWQWEIDNNRYRDTDTGQFMAAARVRELVDERARITGASTDTAAEMLAGGQLNTRDWETQMRAQIKSEYIQQYTLGRGGLSQMTPQDWGSIGGMIGEQYRRLGGFAQAIEAGTLSEAQVAARSRMYINSGREAFERAQRRTEADADEVLWSLGAADHCPDCVRFAALGWQPIEPWPFMLNGEAMPGTGNTLCLTNCQCGVRYRKSPDELPEDTPSDLIDLLEEEPQTERDPRPLGTQETQVQEGQEEG